MYLSVQWQLTNVLEIYIYIRIILNKKGRKNANEEIFTTETFQID